jgi:hypothetical protein
VNHTDEVEFGSCNLNHEKDSLWKVEDERIKSKWNSNLCLDFNFDNEDNQKFKVTHCNGNPQSNRDFRRQFENTIVWDKDVSVLANINQRDTFLHNYRPVKIQNRNNGLCVNNPNDKISRTERRGGGRGGGRDHHINLCPGCMTACDEPGTQWYLKKVSEDS